MSCAACGGAVSAQSKSGVCRKCYLKDPLGYNLKLNPDFERNRLAALRLATQANPVWRDKIRAHCRKLATLPHIRAQRSEKAKKQQLHNLGLPRAQTEEARRKGGRTRSARMLAWCPPHLIDEYRRLRVSQKMLAADAKAMILELHEVELRRLRSRMGVTGPVTVPEPNYIVTGNDNYDDRTNTRAIVHQAEKARIESLRQRRTLCPICGARSDVGCEHGDAA